MEPQQEANEQSPNMEEVFENLYQDFISQDRDLFLFSGPIHDYQVDKFIRQLPIRPRSSVGLILATYGGVADDAYRLARALQRTYNHITLYICGLCKSAGTLVVLGSDKVVIDDFGELGPLDVQIIKADDIQVGSGLDVFQALDELSDQAFRIFERHLLDIKRKSFGAVTLGTASQIGASLAIGLLSPIAAQINPDRLGEIRRAIQIATEYGKRLGAERHIIHHLIHNYPAHGFVIDREEAQDLFGEEIVRSPDMSESVFFVKLRTKLHKEEEVVGDPLRVPHSTGLIVHINPIESEDDSHEEDDDPSNTVQKGGDDQSGSVSNREGGEDEGAEDEEAPRDEGEGNSARA